MCDSTAVFVPGYSELSITFFVYRRLPITKSLVFKDLRYFQIFNIGYNANMENNTKPTKKRVAAVPLDVVEDVAQRLKLLAASAEAVAKAIKRLKLKEPLAIDGGKMGANSCKLITKWVKRLETEVENRGNSRH